ncbi:hypothetical protein HYH03_006907 [Edaphochlamys debaryana]|uniref:Uncharacterized protein n=1 Tax=Edaphochlamys debaryana TaxID=47281 RepID=A0A835YCG5_9CHLO|nr:hypothetical protein HYH03_006907 [Edaphochlamys debaryana]|eukprot:KAG2494974.1 hypothetical protein HYH03_006907 [Edaphochlamys debaryana]
MVAPWQETQFRVIVEFKKGGSGARRTITLSRDSNAFPSQLVGRVQPEVWGLFVTDLQQLTHTHPYLQTPSMEFCCSWLAGFCIMLVVGFGCFPGDDYGPWLPQLQAVLDRHRAAFAAGGATLKIGRVHGSYWAQIDVDPTAMAVGAPVYYAPQQVMAVEGQPYPPQGPPVSYPPPPPK